MWEAMNSQAFGELDRRRKELATCFLNFPNADSQLVQNHDKIKAFIILVHSELESYFEGVAAGIKSKFKQEATMRGGLENLPVAFFLFPTKAPEITSEYDLTRRGSKVLKEFETYLAKRNNGIKEKDVLTMLLPLGISHQDIGISLLNTLNDYGEKRCSFAHTGRSAHARWILDRDNEDRMTSQLIAMIGSLDQKIMSQHVGLAV